MPHPPICPEHAEPGISATPCACATSPVPGVTAVYNGMPAKDLGTEGWRKPWSGGNGGNCLEAMKLADGRVAVRQSTDPDGPALIYSPAEITAFILGAKAGEADFLIS